MRHVCGAYLLLMCGLPRGGSQPPLPIYYQEEHDCRLPEQRLDTAGGSAGLAEVNVVYVTGAENLLGLMNSMVSLHRHLNASVPCTVHLFVPSHDVKQARLMAACLGRELPSFPRVRVRAFESGVASGSGAHYYDQIRSWAFDFLRPTVPRVLYLDTDTIVKSDLSRLYFMRMRTSVAAVRGGWAAEKIFRLQNRGDWHHHYANMSQPFFNIGVTLVDLADWRRRDYSYFRAQGRWGRVPDFSRGLAGGQMIMNVEFQDVDALDWRYNVWGLGESDGLPVPLRCIREARILHWSGFYKPWTKEALGARVTYQKHYLEYNPPVQCIEESKATTWGHRRRRRTEL